MPKKNKGSVGIQIDAPTNFDTVAISDIAAGFVNIMEAGAIHRLEQSTIQKAIDGFAGIVHKVAPNLMISNCSISNGGLDRGITL